MQATETILAVLGSSAKPVEGRTAIQKLVYFCSIDKADLGYRPHFYGPYSPMVARFLEDLLSLDFIEEESRVTLNDRILYTYNLTSDGFELAKNIQIREPKEYARIAKIVNTCEQIANNDFNVLSWAAKVYFIIQQKGTEISSRDQAVEMSRQFGWQLTPNEIDSGLELLFGLGLVKTPLAA